ncbi:Ig-like domain-containing protein, partial [Limnohabitans planktonicus]
ASFAINCTPVPPAPLTPPAPSVVVAPGGITTPDTTPTFQGTGTPGNTIQIKDPAGNVIGSAVVGPNGQWNVTPTAPLPQGSNNLAITETSPSGAVSPSVPLPVVIDSVAPSAPSGAIAPGSNTGSTTDNITSNNKPTLTGTGTPGDTIKITDPQGNVIGTAVVGPNGQWSITPTTALPTGTNNLSMVAIDPAGNVSPTAPLPVVIESGSLPAPTGGINSGSNTGSPTDNITTNPQPVLSGTGTPGNTIQIKDPAGNVIGSAVVGPNGQWNVTPTAPLPQGSNNLSITETSPSGAVSPSVPLPVVIDSVAPSAPAGAIAPGSNTGSTTDNITSNNKPTLTG